MAGDDILDTAGSHKKKNTGICKAFCVSLKRNKALFQHEFDIFLLFHLCKNKKQHVLSVIKDRIKNFVKFKKSCNTHSISLNKHWTKNLKFGIFHLQYILELTFQVIKGLICIFEVFYLNYCLCLFTFWTMTKLTIMVKPYRSSAVSIEIF